MAKFPPVITVKVCRCSYTWYIYLLSQQIYIQSCIFMVFKAFKCSVFFFFFLTLKEHLSLSAELLGTLTNGGLCIGLMQAVRLSGCSVHVVGWASRPVSSLRGRGGPGLPDAFCTPPFTVGSHPCLELTQLPDFLTPWWILWMLEAGGKNNDLQSHPLGVLVPLAVIL